MDMEEYRTLQRELKQSDIDELHRENGEDRARISKLKADAAALNKAMDNREREIRLGTRETRVLCRWSYKFDLGVARLFATDTGDKVDERALTPKDRQTTIDGAAEPTPADIVGKGATTIETGLAWAGRRPGPAKGPDGLPVVKLIAAMLTSAHAAWNGQRWLALSDEPERGDDVLVRHNEGEERLHPMDDVWVSRWKLDPPKAEPAPKQLPPAPSPSTAELRAELDADEIAYADLAADLRSLGKVATETAIMGWTVAQCREAAAYVRLMDQQRIGVDVGDPVCPPHVAALPEYHRSEPGEIVEADFDDYDPHREEWIDDEPEQDAERLSYEDAWEAEEAHHNPVDGLGTYANGEYQVQDVFGEPDAIPEPIEDEPVTPAKPRERKAGGKAKGKAGNGAKGRKKPAAE